MKKTIACEKCGGRGYFTVTCSGSNYAGVTFLRCEVCEGNGMIEVPVTNADRIRSMTDEELAAALDGFGAYSVCDLVCGGKCYAIASLEKTASQKCREIILAKLKEPYKEKEHGKTIGADTEA